MAKFCADSMYEPIEIVIGGKGYVITKVDKAMMDGVTQAVDAAKDRTDGITAVDVQLGAMLGAEPETFKDLDSRVKNATMRYLTNTIGAQLRGEEQGNAQATGAIVSV